MGNNAKQCRLGLFQDSDFAGDLEDSKSTSGGTSHVFGSHTFVPISWMCKKQTAVSHSSRESEIISLDTGLRLDGLPALELWDIIVSVFGSVSQILDRTGRLEWSRMLNSCPATGRLSLNQCRPVLVFTCRRWCQVPVQTGVVRSWVFLGEWPFRCRTESRDSPPPLRWLKGSKSARIGGSRSPRASRSSSHEGGMSGLLYVRYLRGRSVAFCRFLPGRSMFFDFGSLHQEPQVGGTHGRVSSRQASVDVRRTPWPSPFDRRAQVLQESVYQREA